jgi:UDP-3-O-[3-hydroxymyristoyl] glucosamine N-acyltransferase
MGGQAGVADHLTVGEGASIGAQAGVLTDIAPAAKVMGTPAVDGMLFKRTHGYRLRLRALFQQVKQLQRRLEAMERQENAS